jgi:pyruvate ferredoxin oxidoreductase gamma subunit/2-oxoisovalerate ferredoxin oxidoreductase gamma subunit
MLEIRFHGRGGQGTVVASILMAKAFFKAGYYVQTFPVFGVERRGAPVEAYLRLAEEKILIRSNVYTPDHVLVQDAKLLQTVDVTSGLKPGGWILINTPAPPDSLRSLKGYRLALVDATGIAIRNQLGLGTQPIINTAMIGAFARVLENPPLEMISDAIHQEITAQPQKNVMSSRQAHEQVQMMGLVSGSNTGLRPAGVPKEVKK